MNFVGFWPLSLTLPSGLDERHPQNNSIMLKVMLEKWHHAQLILAVFDALFHPRRHEHFIASVPNVELTAMIDR